MVGDLQVAGGAKTFLLVENAVGEGEAGYKGKGRVIRVGETDKQGS